MGPKQKGQKMNLQEFMGDQSLGSWADEMEDMPLPSESRTGYGGGQRSYGGGSGFGGERGERSGGFDRPSFADRGMSDRNFQPREQLPLPTQPPFTAHLGNLPFDATEGDIQDFFSACDVTNVRIVEDKFEHRPKGFGYVEYGSLEGLKKALDLSGTQFQNRNIRVSVAEPPKERAGESRDFGDWTRKGPLPDLPQNQRRPSDRPAFSRNLDSASDAGSERGDRRRAPAFESDGKSRDFSNWERRGPLSPLPTGGPQREGRARGDGPRSDDAGEQRAAPNWNEARSGEGSRNASRAGRREFSERPAPERQPTAADMDNQWRSRMRPDAPEKSTSPTPDPSTPSSPAAPAAPASRPKLNLQKRTVSEANPNANATLSASSESKASPFGAARPVDSAAREREIDEKRQQQAATRKEQDDKAREEQRAKDAASRAEREKQGLKSPTENGKMPFRGKERRSSGAPKENTRESGETSPQQGRKFEILQRVAGDGEENGDGVEDVESSANGNIIQDKEVKPQQVVRDIGASSAGAENTSSEPTTEVLEDEGWNTVPAPRKNKRGGSRALAS